MKILRLSDSGNVIMAIKNAGRAPKTVVNKFLIENPFLDEWYPIYKSAEYRYDKENDKIVVNRDFESEIPSPIGQFSALTIKLTPLEFMSGYSPEVYKENRWILTQANKYFGLSDGHNFNSQSEVSQEIAKVTRLMDILFNQINIAELYGKDTLKEFVDNNNLKLEILGAMYNLYHAYYEVFKLKEG